MKRLFHLIYYILFIAFTSHAQIINVPADQPTIQKAINASVDGDTVLVADGTYVERINFKGKAITVASWFIIDGDNTHIENTIINAIFVVTPDSGSVVVFNSGEDTTSVLYGFTITGGSGTINPPDNLESLGGGGIAVLNSGAKIQYNKITYNTINYRLAVGGGIVIAFPANPVLILNNYITNNKLISSDANYGGGGGILCYQGKSELVLIAGNVIADNDVVKNSGELTGLGGGGVYLNDSYAYINNNLIKNNKAAYGGGIFILGFPGSDYPNVVNNTIIYNKASNSGGGFEGYPGVQQPGIINCIFWGNTAPENSQIGNHDIVEYSDVEGSFSGVGNIDVDPLFADTTLFYLSASSPCIDAGNLSEIYFDIEDQTNPGYALYPALGGLRNDMGYTGGNPYMNSDPTPIEGQLSTNELPRSFELKQNYPNPFNPSTTIKYSIPIVERKASFAIANNGNGQSGDWPYNVTLKVYDILGREVATIVNEQQRPGSYEVRFDASYLSNGVYFYKLTAGTFVQSRKMILLK